jgi:putative hemin transport protein
MMARPVTSIVHERKGYYRDVTVTGNGQMGCGLGDIDLRLFGGWASVFAIEEQTAKVPSAFRCST